MKYREELQNKERTTSYLKEPQKLVTARNDNDVEYKARLVSDDLSQIEELVFEEGVLRGKPNGLPDLQETENLWKKEADMEVFTGELQAGKLLYLGIPLTEGREKNLQQETAALLLSLNSPLEISMEKNYRGELFWSIAAQKGTLPSIEDGLRSLYGQVKLEPISGQQEQFPYKSRAFLQRNLCKEENGRKEIETDPVFNWPSAVAGAMLSGPFRVKIRIRKGEKSWTARQMKETVRQYNQYGDYLSVSVQGSANGSISVSKKADFKEGMSTSIGGGDNKPSLGHGISASVSLSKKQLWAELFSDDLKAYGERLLEAARQGVFVVSAEIEADREEDRKTLEGILSMALARTSFSVSWRERADTGEREETGCLLLPWEAVYFAQVPEENFPGFERKKNPQMALNSSFIKEGEKGVFLGHIMYHTKKTGKEFSLPVSAFNRHAFICGMTGAGKSNTIFHLLRRLDLPFMVIEPVKSEYYQLKNTYEDMKVYTMSVPDPDVLQINPFWFPPGASLQYHIDSLKTIISSAFALYAAMPNILEQCLYRSYVKCGWNISSGKNVYQDLIPEEFLYPTFGILCQEVERYLEESDYEGESLSTYKGALLTRLQSFTTGTKGILFNNHHHPDYGDWYKRHVTIELEELADDGDKCILMGIIMTQYFQFVKLERGKYAEEGLRHLLIIEEAHRLFKNVQGISDTESVSSVEQMVDTLSNMMAEIRAYGEGLFIVDQSPAKIAEDVIRNSNIKIVHRMDNKKDMEMVESALRLQDNLDFIAELAQGETLVRGEGMHQAARVYVPKEKGRQEEFSVVHRKEEENYPLIFSAMADYILMNSEFTAAFDHLLGCFLNSLLYDSIYEKADSILGFFMDETFRLVCAYGNGMEYYGDKPDFLLYLSKKEMQKKLQKKYPLHNLLNTYILMMAGRCIELYLENGNLTADEIRILADFRENTIFSHMEDMYRNSRNRIYERIFQVSGGISIYCSLILDIAAGMEEECGDFMEKGRYEDQWKAGLIRRHVSMEFLLPVNPEVWDTLTRRICKLLKVPYQKNRTEAK